MASRISPNDRGSEFIGSEYDLEITNVAHGGVGVSRHEGRVIFVADTIPGETVRARITDATQKSFWRADTVEVLKASPHRQPHIWAAASIDLDPKDRAGGAEFGHIKLARQRELKEFVLTDSLSRMAHLTQDVTVEALPGDEESQGTNWRTRVRLHVDEGGTVGPYASRSHRVIPVRDLPLATDTLAKLAPLAGFMPDMEFVDLIDPSGEDPRMIVTSREEGRVKVRPARDPLREVVGEREFAVDARGFWQVHRQAATTLSNAVTQMIDEELFEPHAANLDLYGGVGLFAAAIGDRFGSSTGMTVVESDEMAVAYAAENLAEWSGAYTIAARVDDFMRDLVDNATADERVHFEAATVVLDPPRAGAGRDVIEGLAQMRPAQIVYVACDPVALSRDVESLARLGYKMANLRAFDLFPNTHHVEAVARFIPAG
jgi:tRNA/tmRNA/rRNA uracil-C5-methylase (TrmA/RlmC/RlmD family)